MDIYIDNTLLASPDLALGRVGPAQLTLNGRQLVDEVDFFRAASPAYFVRGGAGVLLQFSATRLFATPRLAEAFFLQHWGAMPREGLVSCVVGEDGDQQTVYLRNAAVETIVQPPTKGVAVAVHYAIRGGLFESDVPLEDLPGEADEEEEFIVMRRGRVSIGSAATSVAVTFSAELASVACVTVSVSRPTGGAVIRASVREDSITTSGFTADLSAATPHDTYKLHYIALE